MSTYSSPNVLLISLYQHQRKPNYLKASKVAKTTTKTVEKPPTANIKAVNFDFYASKVIAPRKSSRIKKLYFFD